MAHLLLFVGKVVLERPEYRIARKRVDIDLDGTFANGISSYPDGAFEVIATTTDDCFTFIETTSPVGGTVASPIDYENEIRCAMCAIGRINNRVKYSRCRII